jgi:Zn-finger domain-containing protein
MIVHDENEGIIISIDNIDPALINMLKDKYGDGLTVEIHSYCKEEDGIWEAMKKTKISLGKASLLKYQITSADATENGSKIVKESTEPVTSGDF